MFIPTSSLFKIVDDFSGHGNADIAEGKLIAVLMLFFHLVKVDMRSAGFSMTNTFNDINESEAEPVDKMFF
ncbi:MAG: hypothetical protein ACYDA7_03320 [Acidithiobacillus sp.]